MEFHKQPMTNWGWDGKGVFNINSASFIKMWEANDPHHPIPFSYITYIYITHDNGETVPSNNNCSELFMLQVESVTYNWTSMYNRASTCKRHCQPLPSDHYSNAHCGYFPSSQYTKLFTSKTSCDYTHLKFKHMQEYKKHVIHGLMYHCNI